MKIEVNNIKWGLLLAMQTMMSSLRRFSMNTAFWSALKITS